MSHLLERFASTRSRTLGICDPLALEDYVIQSMPDVSPPKWHLAHTTWFFEQFVLKPFLPGYRPFDDSFSFLFNSYYTAVGPFWDRSRRGLLSRPTVREVLAYRRQIDDAIAGLIAGRRGLSADAEFALTLGLEHERQHQELLVTDIKHIFWTNPSRPALIPPSPGRSNEIGPKNGSFVRFPEGTRRFGNAFPGEGHPFAFDNECPPHSAYVGSFEISTDLVTNGDYLEFMETGAYSRPLLWLSDGWRIARENGWSAPLYWEKSGNDWWMMTLSGMRQVRENEPVCHVSYFEAAAYAKWKGTRLPTEYEWEIAATAMSRTPDPHFAPNFLESGILHPVPAPGPPGGPRQLMGDTWEWTQSAYAPYPGFEPFAAPFTEYNGKFMNGQFVLRGGSCATPGAQARPAYRNYFPPHARWQFTGFRLARCKPS